MSHSSTPDPFEKSQYRKLFAWSERLEREWPLLSAVLGSGPNRRVLDLGCGSGEHSAFLQGQGYEVTGVDASARQIESAREHATEAGPFFVHASMEELSSRVDPGFGGAICLGNVLPYLEREELEAAFAAIGSVLAPDAPWLLQIVNYPGLRERGVRTLPVNVRPGDSAEEELVLVRLLHYTADGDVLFSPTTIRWRVHDEPPTEIAWTKTVRLRAWSREDLVRMAERHGFLVQAVFGTITREDFDPVHSHDLFLHLIRS